MLFVCIYMCSMWLRQMQFKYVNVQLYSNVALSSLDLFGMLAAYNYELLILLTHILELTNCPKLNLLLAIAETVVETYSCCSQMKGFDLIYCIQ